MKLRQIQKRIASLGTKKIKKKEIGEEISIIALVDSLISEAYKLRASDIHVVPQEEQVRVRLRIDGVLQDMRVIPKKIHAEVISRVKVLAGLRTDEHQAPQDGRFRVPAPGSGFIDVRVSIAPTYYGENVVLRLLSDKAEEFSLESLGFSKENQARVNQAATKPYGMILATGPTGSGKTTTLYTVLKALNTPEVSIVTIEDPIEYAVSGIEQIQVNPRTGLTFATGLRSILRQDPDIIMVGEIRDSETAGIGVNTALTGHLLLSSLHTNDAATTLPRLLDLGIESYLIASTVNIVLGQRLVRTICRHCKVAKKISKEELKSLTEAIPAKVMGNRHTFYFGRGCKHCNETGYKGRIGIQEVMIIDNKLRDAILRRATANELKEMAIAQGMSPMIEDGFKKVADGITTISEILRMLHE